MAKTTDSAPGGFTRLFRMFMALLPAMLYVVGALKARAQAAKLPVLAPSDDEPSSNHVFWITPGVTVDDATRRAASAFAREGGFDVVDLLPGEVDGVAFLELISRSNAPGAGKQRLDVGQIAGLAMLVSKDLVERSGMKTPADTPEMVYATKTLRRYGANLSVAVAPGLGFAREDSSLRGRHKQEYFSVLTPLVFLIELAMLLPPLRAFARPKGVRLLTLAAFNVQPLLASQDTPIRIRDPLLTILLRPLLEIWRWLLAVLTWKPAAPLFDQADGDRYAAEIAGGPESLLEPRRQTCPLCESDALEVYIHAYDVTVMKPGEFYLERCRACGHIFQNPRLTIAGLDYYYRDTYDGLNGANIQLMFEVEEETYRRRARRLQPYTQPKRWLDVGTGYGHLPFFAKEIWPDTQFDGLDIGEGINEAKRRGWVAEAHQGFFPDLAPTIPGSYDVISMMHYLEHTREPREEIQAAHDVLVPGGYLLIEVPNPISPLGKMVGGNWYGWLQPQHQHFLTERNFERLFAETGFEAVQWHWGECHMKSGFMIGVLVRLMRLAPGPEWPWIPKLNFTQRMLKRVVWSLSPLLLIPAAILDQVMGPYFEGGHRTAAYGVLARRKD